MKTTTRRAAIRGGAVAAVAFAVAPAVASAKAGRAKDPLIDLERQFLANEERFNRAVVAQENAEIAARAAGFKIDYPRMTVGYYLCVSPQEVKERALEAGFSRQRTAELVREFRRRESVMRQQCTAAGLDPFDEEYDACTHEHGRLLEAIAATPATSVAGLAVKIRFMKRDLKEGESLYADELASSTVADAERLA